MISHVTARVLALLTLCLLASVSMASAADWGSRRFSNPDDVLKFIDGRPPYRGAKDVFKVTAVHTGAAVEFTVFFKPGGTAGWGWKRATTLADAVNFLNGKPPYKPLKAAEVAAVFQLTRTDYYIFYKNQ